MEPKIDANLLQKLSEALKKDDKEKALRGKGLFKKPVHHDIEKIIDGIKLEVTCVQCFPSLYN